MGHVYRRKTDSSSCEHCEKLNNPTGGYINGVRDRDVVDIIFPILLRRLPEGEGRIQFLTEVRGLSWKWNDLANNSSDWVDHVWLNPLFRRWFALRRERGGTTFGEVTRACPMHPIITLDDLLFNPRFCGNADIIANKRSLEEKRR